MLEKGTGMKLPKLTAEQSLSANAATVARNLARRSTSAAPRIVPAVSRGERDESQDFINRNCHNLQSCNGTESCNELSFRGRRANECTWHRFRVRSFYIEREIPERGDHQRAIEINDNIANGCLGYFNQLCT